MDITQKIIFLILLRKNMNGLELIILITLIISKFDMYEGNS